MRGFVTRRRVLGQGVAGGALLVGACAPGGGAGTETAGGVAGSASRAPADVVYMTSWNQERLAVLDQGLAIFKEKQPQIKVTVAPSPGNDQIGALFAAGSGPDSLWISGTIGPRLYESGQVLDLTSRVRAAKLNLDKDFISSKLEKWGPRVFAMPHTVSPHAWYYKQEPAQAGRAKDPWDDLKGNWAWPDMLDMAKRMTKVSGGPDDVWGVELDYVRPWYQNSGFVGPTTAS